MRQTKEKDRELGSHRRMRGWGRARDNSTIVQGGVEETGPFPLHRGGALAGGESWQHSRRNRC